MSSLPLVSLSNKRSTSFCAGHLLRGRSADLLQDVAIGDVVPDIGDLAILDAPDVDQGKGHRVAGGRHAQQLTLVCSFESYDGGDEVPLDHPQANRGLDIGKASEHPGVTVASKI